MASPSVDAVPPKEISEESTDAETTAGEEVVDWASAFGCPAPISATQCGIVIEVEGNRVAKKILGKCDEEVRLQKAAAEIGVAPLVLEAPAADIIVMKRLRALSVETLAKEPLIRRLSFALAVAELLVALEEKGIAYLDIKLQNILFDNERVVLCDFGHALHVEPDDRDAGWSARFTPGYEAKEVEMGRPYRVWSAVVGNFGMFVKKDVCGEPKFPVKGVFYKDPLKRPRMKEVAVSLREYFNKKGVEPHYCAGTKYSPPPSKA
jgi:hypothetical protein